MTTTIKTSQGDTDPNIQNTTSTTNSCNAFNATEINATILSAALECQMSTNDHLLPTTTQVHINNNIILDTDLVRVPSMPDDPAMSAVLAPFLDDLLHQDKGISTATTNSTKVLMGKRVFKANKTGELYTETKVLGEGVYKVVDRLGDFCVVKAPKATVSVTEIQQEIEHLEKIRGHRNVVQYFGVAYDSDGMYLRQELCLPKNLGSLMNKRKFLTEPEVRYFGKQIVEGVRAIHRNKIIHRDLNPGNILFGEGMILKISNFGSSIPYSQKSTGFLGSVGFVAPEVVKKEEHTTGMDVFSVGIIMYMMFNYKRPRITDEYGVYPPPGKFYKKIHGSKDAREFVKWALKIDPKQRALIMDLAFHDFLKVELCPTTLPESVFDTAPALEDIIYDSKKSDCNKRKAGEIDGGDGKGPAAGGLSGDEQQQTGSDTIALEELNERCKLDDFTAKEMTEWDIKDVKTRKRELRDWWKMKNVRIQAEVDRLKAKYGA